MKIENCDLIQTVGWRPIITDGSGGINNTRIYTESEGAAITADDHWTGDEIHIRGPGNREITGGEFTNVFTGEDAEEVRTDTF